MVADLTARAWAAIDRFLTPGMTDALTNLTNDRYGLAGEFETRDLASMMVSADSYALRATAAHDDYRNHFAVLACPDGLHNLTLDTGQVVDVTAHLIGVPDDPPWTGALAEWCALVQGSFGSPLDLSATYPAGGDVLWAAQYSRDEDGDAQ